ncbi:Purple acid phosphatase 18 [Symbiodinium microadriaticum]|uniref:Purple acid phosphatase n=1 Tax=Symbiodinium microadriaticum TaxID=2951 RepID=A0A1Q9F1E7_SYMMI|nr:Purple acid phosphatase 18 [Symbiodinium microadriaticum]
MTRLSLSSAILAALATCNWAISEDARLLHDDSECSAEDGCTLVALQRGAVKRTHDEEAEKPRSDRPTKSFTSSYRRPKMIADSPASKFIVNKDCEKPPCSGQVHIQLGGPGEMVVVFASQPESVAEPLVRFGKSAESLSSSAKGTTFTYSQLMYWNHQLFDPVIAGGREMSTEEAAKLMSTDTWAYDKRTGWKYPSYRVIGPQQVEERMGWYKNPGERYDSPAIHTVVLTGLEPGVEYTYQVDNDGRKFSFKMPQEGQHYPYKVGLVGDIGQTPVSNSSFHLLQGLKPELVLLTGDLSYADGYYPRWDSYGIMAEPLNARVPVMSCPGNHEYASAEAFKSYNARYPMPYAQSGSVDPNYWSRDIGPMHVVALNSYAASGPDSFQFNWLKKDLEAFNRKRTPWLVVMMHAPFYNSNLGHLGEATVMMGDLEELFFKHGVNVVLAGHVHSYERTWPVYKNETTVCAPVYINIGDGGNREGAYAKWLPGEHGALEPTWSAFRQGAFGMAELELSNETHAQFVWKRNACFDNGEVDFHPENCSTSGDNSKNALKHDDISWIVRSAEACPNQA